ncbi:MAG: hypothetical protein JW384_04148 [Nitrosomonadaceae bacterium]|nr:hypothetical protein [Nitrosomonadaceae bacterium]
MLHDDHHGGVADVVMDHHYIHQPVIVHIRYLGLDIILHAFEGKDRIDLPIPAVAQDIQPPCWTTVETYKPKGTLVVGNQVHVSILIEVSYLYDSLWA